MIDEHIQSTYWVLLNSSSNSAGEISILDALQNSTISNEESGSALFKIWGVFIEVGDDLISFSPFSLSSYAWEGIVLPLAWLSTSVALCPWVNTEHKASSKVSKMSLPLLESDSYLR